MKEVIEERIKYWKDELLVCRKGNKDFIETIIYELELIISLSK